MTTVPSDVMALRILRYKLVDARRRVAAKAFDATCDLGQCGIDMAELQSRIEAVDRAIADEERINA